MQAEVAATLTGLVFVAVSINLTRILAGPGLPGRAAESLLQLLATVVISACALIPGQSSTSLGIEMLLVSSTIWLLQSVVQILYVRMKTGHPRYWLVLRVVQTHLAVMPFAIAGFLVLRGSPSALYWLPLGFIFSIVAGVENAWILLVEILR